MATLFGVPPSPFVRKVRVVLSEKGIDYDLEMVNPFGITDEQRKLTPLGKVPYFQDDDLTIPDSSVICAYLERIRPEPPLYPADPKDYARALWYEEYADTRLVEKLGPVFFERVVRPKLMKQQTDEVRVKKVLAEDVPPVLDYLEEQVGDKEFLVGGRFTIADVAVATQLQQLDHGGEAVNASRRPRLASYAERILTRPSFKACIEQEKQMFASM